MKLEKREITLNERDSVLDMLMVENLLINAYGAATANVERKEYRLFIAEQLKETANEAFGLNDLLNGLADNG